MNPLIRAKCFLSTFVTVTIILFITSCTSINFQQRIISYDVKDGDSVVKRTLTVTIPPGSRFPTSSAGYRPGTDVIIQGYRSGTCVKFQGIYVSDLSTDYYKSLYQVLNSSYHASGNKRKRPCQRFCFLHVETNWGIIGFYGENPTPMTDTLEFKISDLKSDAPVPPDGMKVTDLLVEVDYDKIFSNSDLKLTPLAKFLSLPLDVLSAVSWGEIHFDWARGICQDVTIRVFDLVPTPEILSLGRYGYQKTEDYTLLLLHPEIHLKVDHSQRQKEVISGNSDYHSFGGTSSISFYRDGDGKIAQVPYIDSSLLKYQNTFDVKQKFDLDDEGNVEWADDGEYEAFYSILGSSGDMHFCKRTRDARYLALFQSNFRNSLANNDPLLNPRKYCCPVYECGSALVTQDDMNKLLYPEYNCEGIPVYTTKAVYGERNLITAVLPIMLNNFPLYVNAGTTIRILKQNWKLNDHLELQRKHSGAYTKFCSENLLDIYLLPGDRIEENK